MQKLVTHDFVQVSSKAESPNIVNYTKRTKTVNGKGGREPFHILSQVTHEIRIPLHTLRVLMKSSISFHNLR